MSAERWKIRGYNSRGELEVETADGARLVARVPSGPSASADAQVIVQAAAIVAAERGRKAQKP